MLGNKLQKFIETAPITDVIQWINQNQHMVYHSVDSLMNRMSDETIVSGPNPYHSVYQVIDVLYNKKDSVSEIDFNILEKLIDTLSKKRLPDDSCYLTDYDCYTNPSFLLILILMDLYDIINYKKLDDITLSNLSELLYQKIMDLYIPSNHPDINIKVMTENFPLDMMLKNCNNTKWFIDQYNEKGLSSVTHLSEILLIFKYISDIYSNREAKVDFFIHLHFLLKSSYIYRDNFQAIVDRYYKYFGDLTASFIVEGISQLDSDLINYESGMLKESDIIQLKEDIPESVMKCFISDIRILSHFNRPDKGESSNLKNPLNFIAVLYHKFGEMNRLDQEIKMPFEPDNGDNDNINILDSSYESYMAAYEALHKDSVVMNNAERKIYKAYKTYKSSEEKVDSQITKAVTGLHGVLVGDVRSEIIEGKKFSAIGLLKKLLGTVAIFSFGKIKAVCFLVTRYALKKNTSISERRKIIMELETELKLIDEKIQDAQSDNNREAKYAMMRTRAELQNALKKIQYGLDADRNSLSKAKSVINQSKKEGEM